MIVEWPEFQLGERCTVKSSKRIFANEYVESGIPFMRSKDVIDKALGSFAGYDLYISEERFAEIKVTHGSPAYGDLLMSSVGNRSGQPYVIQKEGDFHFKDGNILWLSEFKGINSDYLAYWLKSKIGQSALISVMIGSAQKALTIDSIRKLWVRFPAIEQQNRIAEILLKLDKKIELNRQTNQTLENIAQAIFKSWFVDFEPTRAKAIAKEKGGNEEAQSLAAQAVICGAITLEQLSESPTGSPKMDDKLRSLIMQRFRSTPSAGLDKWTPESISKLADQFPNVLVDSELGEIPKEWTITNLGDELDVLETGKRPKGGVKGITEGVPSVGAENIIGIGNYKYDKEKFVSTEFFEKMNRGIIQDFDFLLYKDGGKPGDFRPRVSMFGCGFPYDEFAINEHVFRIRSDYLGQPFLYFQIGYERVLADLRHKGAKAAIPGINQSDVKTIKLVKPLNNELLVEFNRITKISLESILRRSKESLQLSKLRDALLPKLLSGELLTEPAKPNMEQTE